MPLIHFYSRFIAFFRYALDWSHRMDLRVNCFKGSFRPVGDCYSHDAALLTEPVKEIGSIRTFFQAGGFTEIFSVDICSAKQVNDNTSVDQILS